ncbi:NMT1/THI5 like-domain-containing protein [Mycotypha africana]|uniref:NMT1/THI5 like-domain-containing protein n=1 Tax=Mycotypha africana TaxID=64632 RepID=UPI0023003666|nr:NMT1/THI5 like-domain-containing protein [Mycotypha africana]KAI8979764.1 NMT1/THI5 like-domain-containing protein [Mycotypha africana]
MVYPENKITFLTNWEATAYHAPIYLAQKLGFFEEQGIQVAILEPSNPSDVTEIIGAGKIDLGLKAMIHTIAAKARGYPLVSIGTLLDEPFTGVIHLSNKSGITEDFNSLRGKRIGYVGEFGKIQLDDLTRHFGMTPNDYTAVRVGMNCVDAIKRGEVDAGIGIECVQQVELEDYAEEQGWGRGVVKMLRIDHLANLGCCCFCSILYVGNEEFIKNNPEKVQKFMRAVKKATDYLITNPKEGYRKYTEVFPHLASSTNSKIFQRCFRYLSRDLKNVIRDWNKVTAYCKRLNIVGGNFVQNKTNQFLDWELLPEGPGGVEPDTVDTNVVEGGACMCLHPDISPPKNATIKA